MVANTFKIINDGFSPFAGLVAAAANPPFSTDFHEYAWRYLLSEACPILLILAERQSFRCRACGRWLPRCLQHQCPRSLWYHLCCCQTTSTREGAPYSIPTRLVRLSIRLPRTHRFQSTPHICILRIPELSLFTSTEQLKHRFSEICRFQCLRRPCL